MLPVLLLGAFLLPLDFSIVNVALPSIRASLGASSGQLQLVIAFYAVAYAVLLITGGRLGDLFGRRRMFLGGMAAFMLASALCGLAPSIEILVAARLLQGLAAALLSPQILASIRVIFPPGERNRALGFYGATIGTALVAGQLVGGVLIGLHPFGLTWESIFLVNLPVGAVDLLLAFWLLPRDEPNRGTRLDLTGVVVLSVGLIMLVYPLVAGREQGWPAWTIICLALSVPVLALFTTLEYRLAMRGGSPLLDVRLFRDRAFSVGLTLALMVYSSAAFFFTFAVYLQTGLGWSVLAAGLAIAPTGLGFLFGSLSAPKLVARFGHGAPLMGYIGGIVGQSGVIALVLAGFGPGAPMFALQAVAGLGLGVVFPSLIRIVLNDIAPHHAGMASGAVNTAIQIGPALSVPVIGGVFYIVLGNATDPASYAHAFAAVLACIVGSFVISIGLLGLLRPAR